MHRPTAFEALRATGPDEKIRLAHEAHDAGRPRQLHEGHEGDEGHERRQVDAAPDGQPADVPGGHHAAMPDLDTVWQVDAPGRPERPRLVHPARVPRRGLATPLGRAALVHAIAHIEFNAINLALDASCRFAGMPAAYHADWLRIASEEALHFSLLREHLRRLGHDYGDFEAHDGLWEMAWLTRNDVLARMALVPRVLEARGLDVTPGIRDRLASHGDATAATILDRILQDEINHVATGNRWFMWLCEREARDPKAEFARLLELLDMKAARPPLNRPARLAAGFTAPEIDGWEGADAPMRA